MTLKEGGYYNLYSVSSIDAIERITEQRVREIQRALDLLMRKFRQDITNRWPNSLPYENLFSRAIAIGLYSIQRLC